MAAAAALTLLIPSAARAQAPTFLGTWWCSRAMGLVIDGAGNLHASAFDIHRIRTFTPDGTLLEEWGQYGALASSLTGPAELAIDGRGRLIVAEWGITDDSTQTGLQVFTQDGTYLTSWGRYGFGSEPGTMLGPFGVAVGPDGNVYVLDGQRIQVFDLDGNVLRGWVSPGDGLAIAADGTVYAADPDGNRIWVWSSTGELLHTWGSKGSGPGQFYSPFAVAVDKAGNVYVADTYNHRIQVLDHSGNYVTEWGSFGSAPGYFYRPEAILVDGSGNVYVGDTWNGRIQKFGPVPTPTTSTSWGSIKARYR